MDMVMIMATLWCEAVSNAFPTGTGFFLPHRAVKRSDTEDLPVLADPAPQNRVTVRPSTLLVGNEEEYKSRDKRDAVATGEVEALHSPECSGIVFVVEG